MPDELDPVIDDYRQDAVISPVGRLGVAVEIGSRWKVVSNAARPQGGYCALLAGPGVRVLIFAPEGGIAIDQPAVTAEGD